MYAVSELVIDRAWIECQVLWSVSPLSADQRRRGELLELDVLLPPHHPRLLLHAQPRPRRSQRVSREIRERPSLTYPSHGRELFTTPPKCIFGPTPPRLAYHIVSDTSSLLVLTDAAPLKYINDGICSNREIANCALRRLWRH